ncbi:hypothetical protein [Cellvibrio sp.]
MNLKISYKLTGLGWSECELSDGKSSCIITASYLSDALGSMVLAATAIASSFSRASFSFDEEPGEYRWVISSPRLNEIELSILGFSELWGGQPDSDGELIFNTRCLPVTFATAVLECATEVLNTHGIDGYEKKWAEHKFPLTQFQELKRLVEKLNYY